jgi:amidophosphoribosyltransferase
MGAQLAHEAPAKADVIVPVPDSGVPAAMGFSQASGIPYEMGIIRNHYVGRTFIEPTQHIRQLGVRLKHSANRAVVKGKRIVLVDDSIVRGTTSLKIVQMMRDAGAKEVHFRISSPPITHPDYYGIDTPERDKLLAATRRIRNSPTIASPVNIRRRSPTSTRPRRSRGSCRCSPKQVDDIAPDWCPGRGAA